MIANWAVYRFTTFFFFIGGERQKVLPLLSVLSTVKCPFNSSPLRVWFSFPSFHKATYTVPSAFFFIFEMSGFDSSSKSLPWPGARKKKGEKRRNGLYSCHCGMYASENNYGCSWTSHFSRRIQYLSEWRVAVLFGGRKRGGRCFLFFSFFLPFLAFDAQLRVSMPLIKEC